MTREEEPMEEITIEMARDLGLLQKDEHTLANEKRTVFFDRKTILAAIHFHKNLPSLGASETVDRLADKIAVARFDREHKGEFLM